MVGYSEIAARVRTALTQDPRTAGVSIEVIDENGVITLRGKVNSEEASRATEEIARTQEGVIEVVNDLEIEQGEEPLITPPPTPPQYHP
jgi:osmotically-inducible protein OsmY